MPTAIYNELSAGVNVNILLIGPDARFKGGIAQYNHYLANAILETGHKLLFLGFDRLYPRIIRPSGSIVDDRWLAKTAHYSVERVLPSVPFATRETVRKIAQFSPDAIIVPWWVWWWYPLSRSILHATKNATKIVIAHNVFHHENKKIHTFLSARSFTAIGNSTDLVVTHSKTETERARTLTNTAVTTLPHPLYTHFLSKTPKREARKQLNLLENAPIFLFYGIGRTYKGIDLAVSAFKETPEALLVIAGEMWNKKVLKEAENAPNIILVNHYISTERSQLFFAAADAFVLPYRSVSGSGVAAAVAAHGKPIICSDLPPLVDYFPDTMTHLFRSGEKDDLQRAIKQTVSDIQNDTFLLNLRRASVRISEERSWQNHVEAIFRRARMHL